MKVGILTQPLYCNYGGLVQCYALQQTLQRMGHEAIVLQREWNRKYTFKGACVYYAKLFVKKLMGRKESWHYYVAQEKRDYIARETNKFTHKYITPRSEHCYTTEQLRKEVERLQLDAIFVGSDQVWRPDYSPCQPNYFLDFLADDSSIKRISYAASFGGDQWDWSPELTVQCAKLLQKFNAVSVREHSGIGLCKEHFGVDAVQVLDPTMLLDKEDYTRLVTSPKKRGTLFCYVLDRSKAKQEVIAYISHRTSLTAFENMPLLEPTTMNLYGDIEKCVTPPVEDWLSAFMEAEMVVTDSFHGCVFSIIFNKPFWVVGNRARGLARFESLLQQFDLLERLISPIELESIDVYKPIDWKMVNQRRTELKKEALNFIESSLKSSRCL